jgi:hypothetical protein
VATARDTSGDPLSQLPEALRERLAPRVERLGYLGEFFVRAAPQPVPLAHFFDWTESLKDELPFRIVEAVALTIASRTGNDYERVQHERLALAGGMTVEEITAIESGNLGGVDTLSDAEVAAAALSRCVIDGFGRGCNPALLRLSRCTDERTAVACLMMIGRYVAHATMSNVWGLRPPVASPLDERGGPGARGD